MDAYDVEGQEARPKRRRTESERGKYSLTSSTRNTLELDGIVRVLKKYEGYGGGINCYICGKLYWSKVCFVKHLWEHSVYWDVFKGAKNHERVLSIQAALILYSGCQSSKTDSVNNISPTLTNDENSFDNLVVTSPNKKEKDGCLAKNVEKSQAVASATSVKRKLCSPLKAKQNNEKTDGVHGDSRNMNGVENKNTKPNTPRKQKLSQPLLQTPQKRRRNFSGGSDSGVECPAEILT